MGGVKSSLSPKVAPINVTEEHASLTRGRTESTVEMKFDMWLMPASDFMRLSELRPHEELRAEGKVVRCNPSHTTVFYVSHQWTSTSHPDHSSAQLRAFQTLLLRMIRGELPDTAPLFADAVRLPSNVNISTKEWQTLVKDAFIWMDFISVRLSRLPCRFVSFDASWGLPPCTPLLTDPPRFTDHHQWRVVRQRQGFTFNRSLRRKKQPLLRALPSSTNSRCDVRFW